MCHDQTRPLSWDHARCFCLCHESALADWREAYHRRRLPIYTAREERTVAERLEGLGADRRDPIDATLACPRCQRLHCEAFSSYVRPRPPERLRYDQRWKGGTDGPE